jgi:hypothetical protein
LIPASPAGIALGHSPLPTRSGRETTTPNHPSYPAAHGCLSTLEGIEADQIAGKPFDAEKHARLAGSLARLLDRLGLTVRPGVSSASASPPFDAGKCLRDNAAKLAQEKAISEGWSDTERDRYAEELWQQYMKAA